MQDRENGDGLLRIIDAVDDAIGAAPSAVSVSERRL